MIFDTENRRLNSGQVWILSEDQRTMAVNIECRSGYFLRAEEVSGLLIEAKRPSDITWTTIDTTPIDLSPFVSTVQVFQIRFTADATVTRLRRRARITVAR